ncbi:MAG: prolyl oligopeptidase family serine peptidase [Caldilineaceae bacterium]|nr:prolyl oligopeptidase family serine peptidase [Caldilineaceae bacterium]
MVANLHDFIEQGWFQLYCVDSVDMESFYCSWAHPAGRIQRHMVYEEYLLHEVVPLIESKNPNRFFMAHGCSFGAYHAMNIALRHPQLFRRVVALSGKYDMSSFFSGYYDENIYFHTPSHYVPNLYGAQLDAVRRLEIILAVGEADPNIGNNRAFSEALWSKNIWHAYREWAGWSHDWPYWKEMARQYIRGHD